jgi:photosystem II stability/assembly factor-like uncharacterized protein
MIAAGAAMGSPAAVWESFGPPVPANSVAVCPTDSQKIFAGTTGPEGGAGVFKSLDAGAHWVAVNTGLPLLRTNCVAFAPSPLRYVYVGIEGDGFYRSEDDGAHWTHLNSVYLHHGTAIAIDPRSPQTVYLGTDGGIYKSTDGGVTVTPLYNGFPGGFTTVRIVLDPRRSNILYIATYNNAIEHCGVWKSVDGGLTWRGMLNGLSGGPMVKMGPGPAVDVSRMMFALAIDPRAPDTLYAGSLGGGVFKTTDAGEHWIHSSLGIHTGMPWGETIYSLCIDPANTKTIYAGTAGGGVFVSRDAAAHWQPLNEGLPPQSKGDEMVSVIWNLAITPGKHGYLYAANYGDPNGIYRLRR